MSIRAQMDTGFSAKPSFFASTWGTFCVWSKLFLYYPKKYRIFKPSITMMETSDRVKKCGAGCPPSGAHSGRREGLDKNGGEPALEQITPP